VVSSKDDNARLDAIGHTTSYNYGLINSW